MLRKSPTLFGLFLFLVGFQAFAFSLYEDHLRPTFVKAGDSTSLQILLAGSGATVLAHQQDSVVRDQYSNEGVMSRDTSGYGYHYGQNAIGSMLALTQYYFDPENGSSHIRAIVLTACATYPIKLISQRERPNGTNRHSFPSGHSSDAFASATSLTYAYGWRAAIVAYPLATFVAMSRVADDAHWFSDVVAGATLGLWMGRATFQESKPEVVMKPRYQIIPSVRHDFLGLNLLANY